MEFKIGMEVSAIDAEGVYEDGTTIDLTGFVGEVVEIIEDMVSVDFGDFGKWILFSNQLEII